MKKILSILVAMAMALSLASAAFSASAEEIEIGTIGDFAWTYIYGDTLTISGSGTLDKTCTDEIRMAISDGCPQVIVIEPGVTAIGDEAFCGESWGYVMEIILPDSVTSIGKRAFYGGYYWTINIPCNVISVGEEAFAGCTHLSDITIPGSVTSIGKRAFYQCDNLIVNIEPGITSIDDEVFAYCGGVSAIPDSITSIGEGAFRRLEGSIGCSVYTIPSSVTSIGLEAFDGVSEVRFEGDVPTMPYDICYGATVYYHGDNPTWTEDVLRSFEEQYCKLIPYGGIAQWNLTLGDDIKANFHLKLDAWGWTDSSYEYDYVYANVAVGEESYRFQISTLEKDENGRPVVSVPVAAAQMTDEITVRVSDLQPMVYTVRQYCDTILADENMSEYHQLVKEMLNYGAMAQKYFDYNSTKLANEGITGVGTAEVPETTADMVISGEIDGIAFYGASLVYRDRIAVRYYFTGDVSSKTFTANGVTYTPVAKDGLYYIEVRDILPQNLEQQITLTVRDSSGETLTVTYGPMNYIVRMNQKESENTKALLKALYNYHLAAKAL